MLTTYLSWLSVGEVHPHALVALTAFFATATYSVLTPKKKNRSAASVFALAAKPMALACALSWFNFSGGDVDLATVVGLTACIALPTFYAFAPKHTAAAAAAAAAAAGSDGGRSILAAIKADLKDLVETKKCGPILIRLSWHDAGVFSTGALKGGCPNAVMRFTDGGEGTFGANAGLPTVALTLLKPITDKWVHGERAISHADLWTVAANVAIEVMGGPVIPTRFGRRDAASSAESVPSQQGRLPDGDKGASHLEAVFGPKGFGHRDIVALSGAHTVGSCHKDRSGFDGPWTEQPLKFDNSYFTEMLAKKYAAETVKGTGNPQFRDEAGSGTMMLTSDLALLAPPFRAHVDLFAASQAAFFSAFTRAWVKLQENGVKATDLRENLLP